MFKFYELMSKITLIQKPEKILVSRGFNIAYNDPKDNKDYLLMVFKPKEVS